MQYPKTIRLIKFVLTAAVVIVLQNVVVAQTPPLHKFTLKGYIKGKDSGYVYMNYIPAGDHGITDSCPLTNGHFILRGNIAEPTRVFFASFRPDGQYDENNCTQFYIEPADMELNAETNKLKNLTLTGSPTDDDWRRLIKAAAPYYIALNVAGDSLRKCQEALKDVRNYDTSSPKIAILKSKIDSLHRAVSGLYNEGNIIDSMFIAQNPDSYVAAEKLSGATSDWLTFASYKRLYNNFSTRIRESFPGKLIKHEIDKEANIYIGGIAKNFIATDSKGDTISLATYKGKKYVLLDFSASWCVPCRQIIPDLKKEYASYDSVLEIISIANQDEVGDWRKAIEKDGAPWPQIIENDKIKAIEPVSTTISSTYYVEKIPALVLIDKNLKIVGKYGAFYSSSRRIAVDLQEQLDKIFAKQ